MIKCTAAEYIQIDTMISIYIPLYKKELAIFYSAFCTANDLLVTPEKQINSSDLTKEELAKYRRIKEMSTKIKSQSFRKQLSL